MGIHFLMADRSSLSVLLVELGQDIHASLTFATGPFRCLYVLTFCCARGDACCSEFDAEKGPFKGLIRGL